MENTPKNEIWFAVVNVFAASKKAASLWEESERYLREAGVVFHGTRTGKAGNVAELTFDACMAGYRKFIAVGGDGTVHDVLNGIAGFIDWNKAYGKSYSFSEFALGVIPLGSGNDWIKSLGITNDLRKAVEVIADGRLSKQDVVRVSMLDRDALPYERETSVSYMVNVGGIGIDAKVCDHVNRLKSQGRRGKILYVTSLIKAVMERRPSALKIICDGDTAFEGRYISVAFGVGKYSGGGMRQTPAAVLDDGLLDMTVIPEIAMHRILCEAPRLFTGTFLKVPELTAVKGRSFTVLAADNDELQPVEVDGEVVGYTPVRLEVVENQINVLVPSDAVL